MIVSNTLIQSAETPGTDLTREVDVSDCANFRRWDNPKADLGAKW